MHLKRRLIISNVGKVRTKQGKWVKLRQKEGKKIKNLLRSVPEGNKNDNNNNDDDDSDNDSGHSDENDDVDDRIMQTRTCVHRGIARAQRWWFLYFQPKKKVNKEESYILSFK